MDSIPSAKWVSEIHKMVPDATVWESEITSSIAASKVFHDFVRAYLEFFAKTFIPKQFGPEVVTLEGDGFGGEAVDFTVKEITSEQMRPMRYTIFGEDSENYSCNYIYSGNTMHLEEMKVIPLVDGCCTLKYKRTYLNEVTEDDVMDHKLSLPQVFNVFEATVAEDPKHDCLWLLKCLCL